jgi:hypothetical protein
MAQTAGTQTIGQGRPVKESGSASFGVKYPTFIVNCQGKFTGRAKEAEAGAGNA